MPTKTNTPTTPENEVETPLEALLDNKEVIGFNAYFQAVHVLIQAEDEHNVKGLDTIEMFEETRKRFIANKVCLAKEAPLKVYETVLALLSTQEHSERVEKRIKSEMKSVFSYYENSLSIRFRALNFTTFAKMVKLFDENPETMTKSKIKALLNVYKNIDEKSTTAQKTEADKKYADKAKNLIIMVEALNLQGTFDADSIPAGFLAIMKMAETMDKGAVNNMINGLRVSQNIKEGLTPKAKTA